MSNTASIINFRQLAAVMKQWHSNSSVYPTISTNIHTVYINKVSSYNLFNAFFLSFFFFSAPLTVLAKDLSLSGRFFPAAVPLTELSLVEASEPSVLELSAVNVLELSPVACEENDGAVVDDDLGGLAWISVIIRAWLE